MFIFNDFQDAFITINHYILETYDYKENSRIGSCYEKINFSYVVADMSTYEFDDKTIGRIDYEYAKTFYDWMISGSTDSEQVLKMYPNVSRFLEKPKSSELPENFNTFYGPRILHQLPHIEKELKNNPNSRRAVISILDKDDLLLLDKNETLEFPCADSATFLIRNNKLHVHVHMRSQNMAQVLKLDMYLWGRFTCELAKKLGVETGNFSSSVVSAHIFDRDVDYISQFFDRVEFI